jgi:EF-hand domain pair
VRTRSRSGFSDGMATETPCQPTASSTTNTSCHGSISASVCAASASTAAAVNDSKLRDLFDSIDVDGSGAIDAEELQHALGLMGIPKTMEEVRELMDGVDSDGSGATQRRLAAPALWAPSIYMLCGASVCAPHQDVALMGAC